MAIDLKTETIIDVRQEAGKFIGLGRGGKPPHHSFFIRAITKGVKGHKLEALRVGSRWITSVEAIQRWAELQTAATAGAGPAPSIATRRKSALQAEREVDRLGFRQARFESQKSGRDPDQFFSTETSTESEER